MTQPKGLFITVEGVDGTGKSTQLGLLAQWLRQTFPDREIVETKNPGGTVFGQQLRSILLESGSGSDVPLCSDAEVLLYMADRAQHLAEVVRPVLERGGIVLCDRFGDSTLAYQGDGRGLDKAWLQTLHQRVCGGLQPDLTLLFDAPVKVLLERIAKGRNGYLDRLEQEGIDFMERVKDGFLILSEEDPLRIQVIDAKPPIEVVHQEVIEVFHRMVASKQVALSQ